MNLLLMRDGWPPMVISLEARAAYMDGIEKAQVSGDRTDYDRFMHTYLN